jgi:hypothetical protein
MIKYTGTSYNMMKKKKKKKCNSEQVENEREAI